MKKRLISMLIVVLLMFSIASPALAAEKSLTDILINGVKSLIENKVRDISVIRDTLEELIDYTIAKFSDIKESSWFKETISFLVGMGAIDGYDDGTFKPDATITRAEFTKIFMVSQGFEPTASSTQHWAKPYVDEATKKGHIVNGEFDNIDKNITRGEIARMVVRSMNESYPDNISKYAQQITDYSSIPSPFKEYALKAYVKGIVTGYPDGSFGADKTATRAEASTMVVRMLDESKRIVPELQKDIADILFPKTDEKAVIERLRNMKPDHAEWATMEEAHADFLKRYGNSLNSVYDMAVTYENTWNNVDYRTIDGHKDEVKAALAKCLTGKKYKLNSTGEPLTLEQYLDLKVQGIKDFTVVEKAKFITDKSLAYLGGDSEAVRIRGYIQFYYSEPTSSKYLWDEIETGKWYETDLEIQFAKFNWSDKLAVQKEIYLGEIREIEGE
ncbi:MAG: S-layer homology domain-containing protein [Clostridia bacterium]